MPPKETSSTVIVVLIMALIALLFYSAWRWMQRTSPSPAAPMHSQRWRPVLNREAQGFESHRVTSPRAKKKGSRVKLQPLRLEPGVSILKS